MAKGRTRVVGCRWARRAAAAEEEASDADPGLLPTVAARAVSKTDAILPIATGLMISNGEKRLRSGSAAGEQRVVAWVKRRVGLCCAVLAAVNVR